MHFLKFFVVQIRKICPEIFIQGNKIRKNTFQFLFFEKHVPKFLFNSKSGNSGRGGKRCVREEKNSIDNIFDNNPLKIRFLVQ
jgi:hypothetical protein